MDEDALDHVATMSDHVTDAEHFDNPKALLAAGTLIAIRDATPTRRRLKELAEAQLGRLRLLQRDGYVARIGANGTTVFRGADA